MSILLIKLRELREPPLKNNCGGSPPNRIPSKNFSNTRNGYRRQLFNDPRLTDKFESYCSESLGYFVEYAALIKYALLHLKVYLLSCFRTPVSYTHLDVYKRQVVLCLIRSTVFGPGAGIAAASPGRLPVAG